MHTEPEVAGTTQVVGLRENIPSSTAMCQYFGMLVMHTNPNNVLTRGPRVGMLRGGGRGDNLSPYCNFPYEIKWSHVQSYVM